MKPKHTTIPAPRESTVRQNMIALLQQAALNATEISAQVGIRERDVYGHLEHIRRSQRREGQSLSVLPAECRSCGHRFVKRERLKRPGRCPLCRGESISQPRYQLD